MTRRPPPAPAPVAPADVALDALAAALAPRVARLLREDPKDEVDADLEEFLARVGYRLPDTKGAP